MTAPAVGIVGMPGDNRADMGDTFRFDTVNPASLTQQKIDDRGHRTNRQVTPGTDLSVDGLLLQIREAIHRPDVPEQIRTELRSEVGRLAGDAIAAQQMARIQAALDGPRENVRAALADALDHPAWCDDCTNGDPGVRFHTGTVGSMPVLGGYTERNSEATVQVDRTDKDGVPEAARVFLDTPSTDMTPAEALHLAGLLIEAAEAALRDGAESDAR